ncbi:MAG: class I SAM-dependent rRNA methyltransferase, partial [Sinobacterium sp.]|nr:class I SAM-dependent rRNA methyltransferase [Sinobacterium sp.]
MQTITLSQRAEKRLKNGHLWIFSNEIDAEKTDMKTIEDGEQVAVCNSNGKVFAHAMMNPKSLICGRIVGRKKPFGKKSLRGRLVNALALREAAFDAPCYRLVYAEGDYLPGLIIDRYNDVCVVQVNSLGMAAYIDEIANILMHIMPLKGVLFRNDGASRKQEGFDDAENQVFGEVPEKVEITENGTKFMVPVLKGQKTGWFYDHRDNRAKIAALSKGKKVLDVFSYAGGWGLQCLTAGAESLTAVDASGFALDCLEENAALNGFAETVTCLEGKAFDAMESLISTGEKFDIVILDPPAFIKKKKDFNSGAKAYRKINELGLRLLEKDGLLVSASCSMHLPDASLQDAVQLAAR